MALDGSNLSPSSYGSRQLLNEVKNNFSSTIAPTAPVTGVLWYDETNQILKIYNGSEWQEAANTLGTAPVGAILAWCPGFFTDGSNGGYTNVLGAGNTVAQQNAYGNTAGWYICDGAAVNESISPIWNAAGRYLPNLTDDRFIQGDAAVLGEGASTGSNTMAHTHQVDPPATTSGAPSATTKVEYLAAAWYAATATHTHSLDIAEFTSDAASDTENRPVFLDLYFIIRVF